MSTTEDTGPRFVWYHYVIYGPNQREHPGLFVVRKWRIAAPDPIDEGVHGVAASLRAARRAVPEGQYRVERDPGDDPSIVESWV
jgi:hypothetical protein